MRGRLIAFEGGEASGKSTQAALLAHRLGAVLSREPGGTALGERIRELLLDPSMVGMDARAETLLLAAARAQHVSEVIRPALEAGRDVVTDRFSHSSLAYQAYGRGLEPEEVRRLSAWATAGLWPDLVVLVELPEEVAARRRGPPDRIEAEGQAFHRRVRDGYRRLVSEETERWRVVDGAGTVEEVAALVWAAVADRVRS